MYLSYYFFVSPILQIQFNPATGKSQFLKNQINHFSSAIINSLFDLLSQRSIQVAPTFEPARIREATTSSSLTNKGKQKKVIRKLSFKRYTSTMIQLYSYILAWNNYENDLCILFSLPVRSCSKIEHNMLLMSTFLHRSWK